LRFNPAWKVVLYKKPPQLKDIFFYPPIFVFKLFYNKICAVNNIINKTSIIIEIQKFAFLSQIN